MIYEYFINLNERGLFFADVRNSDGQSVWEYTHDETAENPELDLITDGFMKHINDLDGLKEYLQSHGIMRKSDVLIKGN